MDNTVNETPVRTTASMRLIDAIKSKYIPCGPKEPDVQYYSSEELIGLMSEIYPFFEEREGELTDALIAAGFMFYDIGEKEILFKWCFKLKTE